MNWKFSQKIVNIYFWTDDERDFFLRARHKNLVVRRKKVLPAELNEVLKERKRAPKFKIMFGYTEKTFAHCDDH